MHHVYRQTDVQFMPIGKHLVIYVLIYRVLYSYYHLFNKELYKDVICIILKMCSTIENFLDIYL